MYSILRLQKHTNTIRTFKKNVVGATSKRHVKRFPPTFIILKCVTKYNSIQTNLERVYRNYLQLKYAVSILEKKKFDLFLTQGPYGKYREGSRPIFSFTNNVSADLFILAFFKKPGR